MLEEGWFGGADQPHSDIDIVSIAVPGVLDHSLSLTIIYVISTLDLCQRKGMRHIFRL